MIEVVYHRKLHRLTVKGHALNGAPGHDLVCASASMLAYTLAANVANMESAKQVKEARLQLDEGASEIACKAVHRLSAPVTLVFDTVCAGFELLAGNYPENISYEIRG